jgi:DNA-binding GntR family transcriptional regulator
MTLTPMQSTTAPDDVHRAVREAILNGGLPAGSQLREVQVAAELGVSRAPLREALRRLEEEGLVVKIPFRGAFVAQITPQTVAEITALRSVVEPFAATQAMEALGGPHRQHFLRVVDALSKATRRKNVAAIIDEHLRFHRLFYEHSGNAMLMDVWNAWESRLRLYLVTEHRQHEDFQDLVGRHEQLAARVLEGDPRKLQEAVIEHLHDARF